MVNAVGAGRYRPNPPQSARATHIGCRLGPGDDGVGPPQRQPAGGVKYPDYRRPEPSRLVLWKQVMDRDDSTRLPPEQCRKRLRRDVKYGARTAANVPGIAREKGLRIKSGASAKCAQSGRQCADRRSFLHIQAPQLKLPRQRLRIPPHTTATTAGSSDEIYPKRQKAPSSRPDMGLTTVYREGARNVV